MAVSTAPAAKAAILAILAANTDLTSVSRTWAPPTEIGDMEGELIFLDSSTDGPAVTSEDDWSRLGAGGRRERYRIFLTVWVEQWGDDPQAVEERAWALWAEVATSLRDDLRAPQTGGNSLLRAAGILKFDQMTAALTNGPASPEKWGARIDASVTCDALI